MGRQVVIADRPVPSDAEAAPHLEIGRQKARRVAPPAFRPSAKADGERPRLFQIAGLLEARFLGHDAAIVR